MWYHANPLKLKPTEADKRIGLDDLMQKCNIQPKAREEQLHCSSRANALATAFAMNSGKYTN